MDPLRKTLPVVTGSGAGPAAIPMDEATAARYGLRQTGAATAVGLRDTFGRAHDYLRISVTERCNLRCSYCMPEEGVALSPRDAILTFEEIERLAALFVRLGVRKIRLTGGEPLVRRDLQHLAARLGGLKRGSGPTLQRLLITSNGLLLEQLLPALVAAGVDGVNLSLDTLRPERFRAITKRDGCAETISAIRAAAGTFRSVKVNAVALRGVNDDELIDLARTFSRDLPIEMRYIEYMPFEGNGWGEEAMLPAASIRAALERELVLEPLGLADGGRGVAQIYQARERGGRAFVGKIGIISSMTEPFCSTCSRLRLTADGHFRWCLLDEGEVDLRAPLRSGATDTDLTAIIEGGLGRKRAGHAPAAELLASQAAAGPTGARSMIRIGG